MAYCSGMTICLDSNTTWHIAVVWVSVWIVVPHDTVQWFDYQYEQWHHMSQCCGMTITSNSGTKWYNTVAWLFAWTVAPHYTMQRHDYHLEQWHHMPQCSSMDDSHYWWHHMTHCRGKYTICLISGTTNNHKYNKIWMYFRRDLYPSKFNLSHPDYVSTCCVSLCVSQSLQQVMEQFVKGNYLIVKAIPCL